MKFSLGVFALGASVVQALLPPEVLLSEINSITERVELLIEPAEAITIQNAQQMVIQSGPLFHVLDGIRGIIKYGLKFSGDFDHCNEGPEFVYRTEGDQILDALENFTTAAQEFATTIYEKRKLLKKVPFVGAPVFTSLRGLDTIARIIHEDITGAMLPGKSHKATEAFMELEETLGKAMHAYNMLGDEVESEEERHRQKEMQKEEESAAVQQYL